LSDQFKNAGHLRPGSFDFGIIHGESRKARNLLNVGSA